VLRAEWADRLPDYFASLVEVGFAEDAGHFVHYETPDLAAAEIDRFFRQLPA
jgi:pimeloyl-ACP methyl ester carboxylesterase